MPNFEDLAHVWGSGAGVTSSGLASAVHVEHNPQPIGPAGQTIKVVQERHPGVAMTILAALEENFESESIQAIMVCARTLGGVGFESPSWAGLAEYGPCSWRC